MNIDDWKKERDRINNILGSNNKPSIMEYFTIGIFDFKFNHGALNIGFIDYEQIVDISYEKQASYSFDLFVSEFSKVINNILLNEAFQMQTIYKINDIYKKLSMNIIEDHPQLLLVFDEFQSFVESNNLMASRNKL